MESDEKLKWFVARHKFWGQDNQHKIYIFSNVLNSFSQLCKLDFNGLWIVYKTTKHCIDAIQR